jgi:hypothetical protein
MCVPTYAKWRSSAETQKGALWTKCAAHPAEQSCKTDPECEPDYYFKPKVQWKQIQVKAGIVPGKANTDQRVPKDKWIQYSAEIFKETPAKMTTFFSEGDKNQDKFVDEGEFSDFANYINNVGSWGCTISKVKYDNTKKKNADGRDEPDMLSQFN